MKSRGNAMNDDPGQTRPDCVISDHDGTTADPEFTRFAVEALQEAGFSTTVNVPYKGAEIIQRHGDPSGGRHSIQIEVNRALYLNEAERTKSDGFEPLAAALTTWVGKLGGFVQSAIGR